MNSGILSWLSSSVGLGLLRNVVMAAGSILVTSGYFTQTQWSDAAGAIVMLLGIILSAMANHSAGQAKAVVQAVNDHPSLTIIPPEQTASGKPVISISPAAAEMENAAGGAFGGGMNPTAHLQ